MKVGVIGCGYWGPNLVRNFTAVLQHDMVAVVDRDSERLRKIQAQYPHLAVSTSPEGLFANRNLDAVAIATPVSTHYGLACAAMEAGKHVLLSKPMTHSTETSERLIELAEARGVTLMVDHTFVYTGAVRKIRELVAQGALGDLQYFDSVRVNLGLFQHDVNVVWDLAPHDLSIMDYVLDAKPVAVSAHAMAHLQYSPRPIENIAYLTMFFDDNFIAHVHVNWLAPVKVRRTLICGDKQMIIYDDTEADEKIKVYDRGVHVAPADAPEKVYSALLSYRTGDMHAPVLDKTEALLREVRHFVDCVSTGRRPETDGQAGLRVVRLLEAAQRSLERGGVPIEVGQGVAQ